MTKTYVLFHANCFDGTGAKYAAWKYFGDRAEYIAVNYHQPFPESIVLTKQTSLFILDFSYSREFLDELDCKVGALKVLDHHKTAQAALAGAEYAEFDMNRSGAVMAWEYFHPGTPVPRILQHVQDGDLWKFKLPGTEAVRAALPLLEGKMELWDTVEDTLSDFLAQGNAILASNKLKVDSIVKNNVRILPFHGYKAGVYNTTTLVSEAGNATCLSKDLNVDFSLSYFIAKDGGVGFSLRSANGFDVAKIAEMHGGGGHAAAAGFHTDIQFLNDLYQGKL
jgi:oligoribonuclease NrnB/cAMP/cGMP phosphodiesterase (DHH superfamily)